VHENAVVKIADDIPLNIGCLVGRGVMTGGGVEYSFEAVGLKTTAEQHFQSLRPGGTATIIGMVRFGMKIELHGYDFPRERKIQGSPMGSNRFRFDMPKLLNAWKKGDLRLDHLISSHIKLDDINEGYANLNEGRPGAPSAH
jgi:S-(hydroxymethyl)glutathione dehydrogenase/alcohol dehydrogenase